MQGADDGESLVLSTERHQICTALLTGNDGRNWTCSDGDLNLLAREQGPWTCYPEELNMEWSRVRDHSRRGERHFGVCATLAASEFSFVLCGGSWYRYGLGVVCKGNLRDGPWDA